jgi:hypothetical protein
MRVYVDLGSCTALLADPEHITRRGCSYYTLATHAERVVKLITVCGASLCPAPVDIPAAASGLHPLHAAAWQ